uniref:F-box domain-containing protein n=1 Tax=Aegilops tauschii subsp. strangulata TaxID=200361 RepID=A0A453MUI2_AEGTS
MLRLHTLLIELLRLNIFSELKSVFFSLLSLKDVLCTILSKLPAKEVVWTSALASEWESLWTTCPRLRRCLVLWLVTQTLMVTGHAGGSKG